MKQSVDKYYSNKILELCRRHNADGDELLVAEAMNSYVKSDYKKIDYILEKLGEDYKLLETLINKLKGKSVYTNLNKLIENKYQSNEDVEISLSSLYTHVCIECKTDPRYSRLKPYILNKIIKLQK